ncbi:MAG TPA: hypothetical protein VKU41_18180, partial [Polyangiaceae bacterium]|nr:hypothetical protein [Polyangiaceae bacterium]
MTRKAGLVKWCAQNARDPTWWGTGLQTLRIHDGSRLGPYRLSRLLGRGATSAVYEAVDPAGR